MSWKITDPYVAGRWGEAALRTREAEILGALPPRTSKSRAAYTERVRRAIKTAGHPVLTAKYDAAGNCTRCGECGRCPGVHIYPLVLP